MLPLHTIHVTCADPRTYLPKDSELRLSAMCVCGTEIQCYLKSCVLESSQMSESIISHHVLLTTKDNIGVKQRPSPHLHFPASFLYSFRAQLLCTAETKQKVSQDEDNPMSTQCHSGERHLFFFFELFLLSYTFFSTPFFLPSPLSYC